MNRARQPTLTDGEGIRVDVLRNGHTRTQLPDIPGSERIGARIADLGLPAILSDNGCSIMEFNQQAAEILDARARAGYPLYRLAKDAESAESLLAVWQERCRAGAGWSYECKLNGLLGAPVDLALVVIPVTGAGSMDQRWLVILQDLTETLFHARELEIYAQELSQLYQRNKQDLQRLEEAQKSREQFFSLVTHELKTPLTSLKASLEMLSTPEVIPPSARDAWRLADTMKRSTIRLERLLNDLLDISTARSGGMMLTFSAVEQ